MKTKEKIPCRKRPCKNCPFRKTSQKGWLGRERMEDILNSDMGFVCHETLDTGREQCAGFMLIKNGRSLFELTAKLYNIDLNLSGRELVFDTEEEAIAHHKN